MATPLTLSEKKFDNLLKSYESDANIIKLPCPGLMELVEKGITSGNELDSYLRKLFENTDLKSINAVVLGCTHYPFVRQSIKKLLPEAKLYDGGAGTARQVKRCLEKRELLNKNIEKGNVIFENSLNTEHILNLSKRLLDEKN